ncbi:MAG: hypothetical protein ABR591_06110 [Candidatus Velthaea sp.]
MNDSFERCVSEIDRRVREIGAAFDGELALQRGSAESVTWKRGAYWATVTLHDTPARLELTLHSRDAQHPDALEIAPDDADVVDMIARPVADFLAGAPHEPR